MKAGQNRFIVFSYLEGLFYALMVASSESFALFFSVKKGITSYQLALISTVPLLLGALAQWVAPMFFRNNKLKFGIVFFMGVQLLGLVNLYLGQKNSLDFNQLFMSLVLYWVGGLSAGPLWLDWISRHFSKAHFRVFLSKRNAFVVFCTLTFYLALAYQFKINPELDETIIFVLGIAGRFLSLLCQLGLSFFYSRHRPNQAEHEQERKLELYNEEMAESDESGHRKEGGKQHEISFNKILWTCFIWTGLFKLAVNLSGPFFLPYMINQLHLTLWDYTLLTAMPLLGRTIFLGGWGRASEGYFPFLGLQVSTLFISLIPALWAVSKSYSGLIGLEFISGVFWGGFELSTVLIIQNFGLKEAARIHGLHMAIMNTLAVLGSFLGAFLFKQDLSYHFVFYLSSGLRLLVSFFFILQIGRWAVTRFRPRVYGGYLFTVLSLRPSLANIGRILFSSKGTKSRPDLAMKLRNKPSHENEEMATMEKKMEQEVKFSHGRRS